MKKLLLLVLFPLILTSCNSDNPTDPGSTGTLIFSNSGLFDSMYAFNGKFFEPLDSLDLSAFNELNITFTYSLRNNGVSINLSPGFSIGDSSTTFFNFRKDPGSYISQSTSITAPSPQTNKMFYYSIHSGPISDGYISIRDLKIYGK